jgi:tetratricopeptide (TPR) repeat protein
MKTNKNIKLIIITTSVFLACFMGKANCEGLVRDSLCFSDKIKACNTEMFSVDNQKAYSFYLAGIKFDSDSDYESAIKELNEAIRLDKNFAEAYDKRGVVYTKMLMFGKALKDLSKAIELKKDFSEAYNHRGIVFYCLLEYNKSLSDYNKALLFDPNFAKAYYNRGIVKLSINDDNGAIADFRIASEMKFAKATDYLEHNSVALKN